MSRFSDVDGAPDVGSLVAYLDGTDRGLAPMKSYMASSAALHAPGGVILDVGCGVGSDLSRLGSLGLRPLGVDRSMSMLTIARGRLGSAVPFVQADAACLPFRDASIDGCRIERELQHVAVPAAVVSEIARVVRPGGFLASFDTDYTTYRAETNDQALAGLPGSVSRVRHPSVGGDLVDLFVGAGFEISNVVTERSHAWSFDRLPAHTMGSIERAVADDVLGADDAQRWVDEQLSRSAAGTFRAAWEKILLTATRT
ncbi:MAG: hypothetical protein V7636_2852 [Actinomycetota bacterium]